jgi:hypothetical protein
MYKKDKYKIIILFLFVSFLSYFSSIEISESLMQNFITFLSITFGFYMTSLSVLYSSKFIKKLHKEVDTKIKTQTKLHTLTAYFRNSATWSILSIIVLFTYSLFFKSVNNYIQIEPIFEAPLIGILSINFLYLFLLLKVFLNGLEEEANHQI